MSRKSDEEQSHRPLTETEAETKGLASKEDIEKLQVELHALRSELQGLKADKEAEAEQRKRDNEEIKGMLRDLKERFVQ